MVRNGPGPTIQRINAILHNNEIISSIVYTIYWCIIFGFITPIIVFTYLPLLCCIQIIRSIYSKFYPNNNDTTYDLMQNNLKNKNNNNIEIAIVITGCDTGFGKELAIYVANELGYTVFAGCLYPQKFILPTTTINNRCCGTIIPIEMDVTKDDQIQNVVKKVQLWLQYDNHTSSTITSTEKDIITTTTKKKRILHALINNAGIGCGSIIDWSTFSDFYACMDVNYFGMVRCCKAFLPIFKNQVINQIHLGSRIINITSMAGLISNGCIGLAPYSASKHAANAFSHVLRTELLSSFNIQVTTINPSFHKTPLVDTMGDIYKKQWDQLDDTLKVEYGENYCHRVRELCVDLPQSVKWDMNVVIQQVVQCLRIKYIPPEIIIGSDAKYALLLLRMLPTYIIDFISYYNFPPIPDIMKKSK